MSIDTDRKLRNIIMFQGTFLTKCTKLREILNIPNVEVDTKVHPRALLETIPLNHGDSDAFTFSVEIPDINIGFDIHFRYFTEETYVVVVHVVGAKVGIPSLLPINEFLIKDVYGLGLSKVPAMCDIYAYQYHGLNTLFEKILEFHYEKMSSFQDISGIQELICVDKFIEDSLLEVGAENEVK